MGILCREEVRPWDEEVARPGDSAAPGQCCELSMLQSSFPFRKPVDWRALGLDDYENVNYLRAIKRVVGLEPLPASY